MSLLNRENKAKLTSIWEGNIEIIHHDPKVVEKIHDLICNISPEQLFNLKGIILGIANIQWNFQPYQRIDYMNYVNGYGEFISKLHEGFTCTIKIDNIYRDIHILFDKKLSEIPSIGYCINQSLSKYIIDEEYYHAF